MKRTLFTDPWFYKQPDLSFKEELKKPLHEKAPDYYGKRSIKDGEVDVHGLYIAEEFKDDDEKLLETSYADFKRFLVVYGIDKGEKSFPLFIRKSPTECFEAYEIEVSEDGITILADDTEGVRRALIYVEDELRRSENAYLKPGCISRKPVMTERISRCFFAPTNRPPKNGDELWDDIDYYPEECLNRLMHEGVNGLWIYTRFSDLLPSSVIKEYGAGYEKRMEKLNRVIEKCRRYGIGIYLFAIEPKTISAELAPLYEDMISTRAYNGEYLMCCNSERGKAYCYEAGKLLCTLAPKLKGFISITYGERPTSCSSSVYGRKEYDLHKSVCSCPRCKDKKNGEILAASLEALRSGSRDVNPGFRTISWTYGHNRWEVSDILDYVDYAPDDVILMQNFEDGAIVEQLGKERIATDYWLSYVGPSSNYAETAIRAREKGKKMFAKMQICNSLELATVPFVPVPGILFDKYKAAYEYGTTGIMQCWYFGNYPSVMGKMAGELAFTSDYSDKEEALRQVAAVYYGGSRAEEIVRAWKCFEDGYKNYPVNILFSYYGPMHDGVAWKMSLLPKNFEPGRAWGLCDPTESDRICDFIYGGHDADEILTLCKTMRDRWAEGMNVAAEMEILHPEEREQKTVAEAVGILLDSGTNIIDFYIKRDKLGRREGDGRKLLEEMKNIILLEKENSIKMIKLCGICPCLGYHSEAEGYKFFPEKIEDRIKQLEELLETEFPLVEKRMDDGLSPLEYYDGVEENSELGRYSIPEGDIENAPWENIGKTDLHRFRMSYDNDHLYIELYSVDKEVNFTLSPEYRLMNISANARFNKNGFAGYDVNDYLYNHMFGERADKERRKYRNLKIVESDGVHLLLTLSLAEIGIDKIRPFKMRIQARDAENNAHNWCQGEYMRRKADEIPYSMLGKHCAVVQEFGWIIPEN